MTGDLLAYMDLVAVGRYLTLIGIINQRLGGMSTMYSRKIVLLFMSFVLALSLCSAGDKGAFFAYAENENSMSQNSAVPMVVQNRLTGECAIINADGEYIVPFTSDSLQLFRLGIEVYCIQRVDHEGNQTYALCNTYRTLTAFDFKYIQTSYADDYPILATDDDYQDGYIDASGQWIIPPVFFYAEPFSEGVAFVQTEDNLGYINQQGEFVLKYTYDELSTAESFSEGVAAVAYKNGLWGYIDLNGERIGDD